MNKQKSIIKILFFISITFLYPQEKDFEKSILNAEQKIEQIKEAIKRNNNEINGLKTKTQQTNKILNITKKNIQNSQNLIKAYNKKIDLYDKQSTNLKNAIIANNNEMELIKKQYAERSINLYKKKNQELRSLIFNSNSLNQMVYRVKYYNIISELNEASINKLNKSQFYNKRKNKEIKVLLEDVDRSKKLKNNELKSLDQKKKYQEKLISEIGRASCRERVCRLV